MSAVIAPEPLVQIMSDPKTGRVCVSAWVRAGATSISTDIWLSADHALDVARQMTEAAKAIDLAPSPASAIAIAAE